QVAVMEDGRVIESTHIFDIITNPKQETTKNFVRSIINDDLPQSEIHHLNSAQNHSRIYRFKYIGTSSNEPVVSQIAKKFHIEVNILQGNILDIQGEPFGNLLLEFIGEDREIERAIHYSKQINVNVQEVKAVGNWG